MSLYNTTLDALIERICKLVLHDWTSGTATGGSTSTVVDTARNEVEDYFNSLPRAEIYIRSTTDGLAPIGDRRDISDFDATSVPGTITVPDVFSSSSSVQAGDTYSIHTEFPRDEVKEAVNATIELVQKRALIDAIDETSVTLVANVFEYNVPNGFVYIYRLTMADGSGNFYGSPIPPDQYKIIRGATTPQIHFYGFPDDGQFTGHYYGELWSSGLTATRKLRVEGLKKQATLSLDTDICAINPVLICAQAGAYLHASRIRRPENEPDDRRVQYGIWQSIANDLLRQIKIQLPPNVKKVE